MNFTYTLRKPPDGAWGSKRSDGSWTGMIGELHRKNADMGRYFSSMHACRTQNF